MERATQSNWVTPSPRPPEAQWDAERPKTFGDCQDKKGPCPWISCKYHMLLEIGATGSLKFNVGASWSQKKGKGTRGSGYRDKRNLPVLSQKAMRSKRGKAIEHAQDAQIIKLLQNQKHTCVLKVVQDNKSESLTLDAVGKVLCITRERVRQIQSSATEKLHATCQRESQSGS